MPDTDTAVTAVFLPCLLVAGAIFCGVLLFWCSVRADVSMTILIWKGCVGLVSEAYGACVVVRENPI